MPGEFDFDVAAVSDAIGAELGFGAGEADEGDVVLDIPHDAVKLAGAGQPPDDKPVPPAGDTTQPAGTPAGAPPATPAAVPAVDQPPSAEAPKTWRKEAAAEWATLSPTIKAEIAKREQDMFQGLEGYKADASFGKTINQALTPYLPVLRQYNIDPVQQISGLMQAHYNLATGTPESKIALIDKLIADYKVPYQTRQVDPAADMYVDPAVKTLQTELQGVRSILSEREAREAQAETQRMLGEVNNFAADPKNIYFKDVANDMVRLLESKQAKTLPEAYEQAIWLNPQVRSREMTRQQAESAAKAAADEAAKVAAAKAATAANVRPKAKGGSATTPLGSMDDTLAETFAAIKSRG